ncbi:hypothetical protein F2Q70_00022178 [Brassica cretica]|nr:hypothetical protein F2Q70_00022178 [Brassica cretica]
MPVVEYERYNLQEDTSLVTVIGETFDQLVLNCPENVLLEVKLQAITLEDAMVDLIREWEESGAENRTNLYRDGKLVPMLTEAGAISAKAGTTSS